MDQVKRLKVPSIFGFSILENNINNKETALKLLIIDSCHKVLVARGNMPIIHSQR